MIPVFYKREELFKYLIENYNIKNILEIGVRDGDNCNYLHSLNIDSIIGLDLKFNEKAFELSKNLRNFQYYITKSPECSILFKDEYFDMIYLDADHKYNAIKTDIYTWYSKLKNGGFLCGDDYCFKYDLNEGVFGVVRAVEEFCYEKNLQPYITGKGYIDIDTRLNWAYFNGKKLEDNHFLSSKEFYPTIDLTGREWSTDAIIPQWLIQKND